MIDLKTCRTYDAYVVFGEKVVYGIHGAGERVLDGEDTELAQTAVDCLEDSFEVAHVHYLRKVEKTL